MNETTVDKIFSFKQLDEGWCYGEGISISHETIEKAIRLEARARLVGFSETDAFPGLNGEISVTIYFQPHYFEFTFETDGTVLFVHENNQITLVHDNNLTFETALQKVESLKLNLQSMDIEVQKTKPLEKFLWSLSESSMNVFMTQDLNVTKVTPLNHLTMVAYQLSSETVLSNTAAMSVPMFENFTLKPTALPLLIGSLTKTSSLNIV